MSNLQLLSNVVHKGIRLKKGVIVSTAEKDLGSVAQNLIDRGLAKAVDQPATHTAALVDGSGAALPVNSTTGGKTPAADADEARKAAAQAQQKPATPQQTSQIEQKSDQENKVRTVTPPSPANQPTAADVEGV